MGSIRKTKQKKKDFVKPKLKVGKSNVPTNATNTDFKAKKINLSRTILIPSDYTKKLSLLKKSTTNVNSRKEILTELITDFEKNSTDLPLDAIISTIRLLFVDQSKKVRSLARDTLSLIIKSNENLILLNQDSLMLFLYSAMTHLKPTIRADSIHILQLLFNNENLRTQILTNHWIRLWNNLLILLNWKSENKSYIEANEDFTQTRLAQLSFINNLLLNGIHSNSESISIPTIQQHDLTSTYLINQTLILNTQTDDNEQTLDINDRVRSFVELFGKTVQSGINDLIKLDNIQISTAATAILNPLSQYNSIYTNLVD